MLFRSTYIKRFFKINIWGFLLAFLISIPLGITAAVKKNSLFDKIVYKELIEIAQSRAKRVEEEMDNFKFNVALEEIWVLVKRANKYIDETTPWVIAKDQSQKGRLDAVLHNLAESLRVIAELIHPFMHTTADEIKKQLGVDRDASWSDAERFHICPPWLVRLWIGAYGREEAEAFLRASLCVPPPGVRVNRLHPLGAELFRRLEPLAAASSAWGMALGNWPDFLDEAVSLGQATRQSFATQRILDSLEPQEWPEPVLDACAGRGGKTFLLREAGKTVWASDVNAFRLRQLRAEGLRLGLFVPAFLSPGQGPYPLRHAPRTVFLDAPCSGLGVLSRRPDIKWKRTGRDCRQLAGLQRKLLDSAAGLLPAGGVLAYVTCTLHPEENERQVEAERSEERRVGKECRSRWSPYH